MTQIEMESPKSYFSKKKVLDFGSKIPVRVKWSVRISHRFRIVIL